MCSPLVHDDPIVVIGIDVHMHVVTVQGRSVSTFLEVQDQLGVGGLGEVEMPTWVQRLW